MKTRFLVLALLAAACGSNPFEEEGPGQVLPAVIKFEDKPVVINVPETAEVGEPVTVSVITWGARCLTKGETRVTDSGHSVLIEPFDSVPYVPPDASCPSSIYTIDHEATVVFSEQGLVFIYFRGRAAPENKPYATRRRIFVR
jgi:hypothetical protein